MAVFVPLVLLSQSAHRYSLYPIDRACSCVRTRDKRPNVEPRELTIGRQIFERYSDRRTRKELFRVAIGEDDSKWWTYVIATEGDFNGDGIQDYSWYGGDDTSFAMYVFLSCRSGHCGFDMLRTLANEWARRSGEEVPDLAIAFGKFDVGHVELQRDSGSDALTLSAEIGVWTDAYRHRHVQRLQVDEIRFVRLK